MSDLSAFRQTGSTIKVAASTTTANGAIANHRGTIMVHNPLSAWAYVTTGIGNAITATDAGYWCAPGSSQPLSVPSNHTYVAVLLASGSGNIAFTPGEGQ